MSDCLRRESSCTYCSNHSSQSQFSLSLSLSCCCNKWLNATCLVGSHLEKGLAGRDTDREQRLPATFKICDVLPPRRSRWVGGWRHSDYALECLY